MKKYRLKDEKYRKPAQEIAGFTGGGFITLEYFVSNEDSPFRKRLEEYGVFDLWFEEEPEFKSGDYIYILNTGNMYEIEDCEVREEELHWNTVGVDREEYKYRFSTSLNNIRHATAEEIEEYKKQLPEINGFEGRLEGEYIVYGCQSIHVQDMRRLFEACMYANVSSITKAGQEIKIGTLQEIYKKTY